MKMITISNFYEIHLNIFSKMDEHFVDPSLNEENLSQSLEKWNCLPRFLCGSSSILSDIKLFRVKSNHL